LTDLIIGMGEVGSTIFELLTKRGFQCAGIDLDKSKERNLPHGDLDFIHICAPFFKDFIEFVSFRANHYKVPIIIHSTVRPGTTKLIQKKTKYPVIYSPIRGVHTRFLEDLEYYTKYFSYSVEGLKERFKKIKIVDNAEALERTKILVDTTYYGWLIAFRKIVDDYGEVYWDFAEEPHKKLGNRPIMYNDHKPIGGHCVLPNLELIDIPLFKEIIR